MEMRINKLFIFLLTVIFTATTLQVSWAERVNFDSGWKFAFGNASSYEKDFGRGTEYFNYLTKAASIHNEGPYSPNFDSSKWPNEWIDVELPHDWVVDLPFDSLASHSHGYKIVGYKYPETSVGWYRKIFDVPEEDFGKHLSLQFDGIFRDASIWVNGFYLGSEPSGYTSQIYDISEYLNYGGENVVAVRVDASLEEGWFYEGAGIYRHVWLNKTSPLHVSPFGTRIYYEIKEPYDIADVTIETTIDNKSNDILSYQIRNTLLGPDNSIIKFPEISVDNLPAKKTYSSESNNIVKSPVLWDIDSPQRYTLITEVLVDGEVADKKITKTGFRDIRFDSEKGFFINGRNVKLKGVNMHQDHAGVGCALPDALQLYRLKELKKYGVNAYRSSHNPMTPEMIEACDSLGILVIEENRLMGINEAHIRLLKNMIERDRNHPSIILWSIGNEEWGIEWNKFGERIAASMSEYVHRLDHTRPVVVASSSGPTVLLPVDVAGYNYIVQNPIEEHRKNYPERKAIGTEETSGCGTRGVYFDDYMNGHMKAINLSPSGPDSIYNAIERGWKFYDERPWLGGLFYWTGFDYRGEPNPLAYPATGSQFGILDYCGFPKDEAFYLKSWWTDEPVLHIFPHWNLFGHEGEEVEIWAYSNMDEIELFVNGKSVGRKIMPKNGHLRWKAIYSPGKLKAVGYKNGKKHMETNIKTSSAPASLKLSADKAIIKADNADVAVVNVEVMDKNGNFVPDANINLKIEIDGPLKILGVGNGNPSFRSQERPLDSSENTFSVDTFNGLAQVLIQSRHNDGDGTLKVSSNDIPSQTYKIKTVKD